MVPFRYPLARVAYLRCRSQSGEAIKEDLIAKPIRRYLFCEAAFFATVCVRVSAHLVPSLCGLSHIILHHAVV